MAERVREQEKSSHGIGSVAPLVPPPLINRSLLRPLGEVRSVLAREVPRAAEAKEKNGYWYMKRASYPWNAAAEFKGLHLSFSPLILLSFSSIDRVEFAVATKMSLWDSEDLGDISMKVSWALFGPALRKPQHTLLTSTHIININF